MHLQKRSIWNLKPSKLKSYPCRIPASVTLSRNHRSRSAKCAMKRLHLSALLLITSPVWADHMGELSFVAEGGDWGGVFIGFILIGFALRMMVSGKIPRYTIWRWYRMKYHSPEENSKISHFFEELHQSENPKLFLSLCCAFVIAGVLAGFNGRWLFGRDPPDRVLTQETVTNMSLPKGRLQEYRRPLIVMYSLTTCGYCKLMRRELKSKNIPFIEYFIDEEPTRKKELVGKLQSAGMSSRYIGTPTLEVNGIMLPNNPSMKTVLKHLQSS